MDISTILDTLDNEERTQGSTLGLEDIDTVLDAPLLAEAFLEFPTTDTDATLAELNQFADSAREIEADLQALELITHRIEACPEAEYNYVVRGLLMSEVEGLCAKYPMDKVAGLEDIDSYQTTFKAGDMDDVKQDTDRKADKGKDKGIIGRSIERLKDFLVRLWNGVKQRVSKLFKRGEKLGERRKKLDALEKLLKKAGRNLSPTGKIPGSEGFGPIADKGKINIPALTQLTQSLTKFPNAEESKVILDEAVKMLKSDTVIDDKWNLKFSQAIVPKIFKGWNLKISENMEETRIQIANSTTVTFAMKSRGTLQITPNFSTAKIAALDVLSANDCMAVVLTCKDLANVLDKELKRSTVADLSRQFSGVMSTYRGTKGRDAPDVENSTNILISSRIGAAGVLYSEVVGASAAVIDLGLRSLDQSLAAVAYSIKSGGIKGYETPDAPKGDDNE